MHPEARNNKDIVNHVACPACVAKGRDRHGDNLGVWPDGHKYCFSCHHYEPPTSWAKVFHHIAMLQHKQNNNNKGLPEGGLDDFVTMPNDCSNTIPIPGMTYLRKYNLTATEIAENGILWSEKGIFVKTKSTLAAPLLIFPYYGFGALQGWVGRNLGNTASAVKSVRIGMKSAVFFPVLAARYGKTSGVLAPACEDRTLVVVEDPVSAIKVRRHANAMPLFGSTFDEERMLHLAKSYDKLLIWLDYDKAAFASQEAKNYSNKFKRVRSIVTKQDPKDMDDGQIRMELRTAEVSLKPQI